MSEYNGKIGPFEVDEIPILENILNDIKELKTAYYNTENVQYPYFNKDNPFENNYYIKRIVLSCLQTIFEQFIALNDKDSYITKFFSDEEIEQITAVRNEISHEYAVFRENDAIYCVKTLIPVMESKFENVMEQYKYLANKFEKEKNLSETLPNNLKFKPTSSITKKLQEISNKTGLKVKR